jgi:hypothetical protein
LYLFVIDSFSACKRESFALKFHSERVDAAITLEGKVFAPLETAIFAT